MQLLSGGTLTSRIGTMSEADKRAVVPQIVAGLVYLHGGHPNAIIHRDLKVRINLIGRQHIALGPPLLVQCK